MSKKSKADMKINEIIQLLKTDYPEVKCGLDFESPFYLMIALILAAQCTDAMVNKITPPLFQKYPDPQAFAQADLLELEQMIRASGFYHNKAKNIMANCQKLLRDFGGQVPNTMEQLMSLPGIGRKSANIIMSDAFGITCGIAVDTHVARLSRRIGLSSAEDPSAIEQDLLKIIPKDEWKYFNHLLVTHGRAVCNARRPNCETCNISRHCRFYIKS